jgi:hypothetical protein
MKATVTVMRICHVYAVAIWTVTAIENSPNNEVFCVSVLTWAVSLSSLARSYALDCLNWVLAANLDSIDFSYLFSFFHFFSWFEFLSVAPPDSKSQLPHTTLLAGELDQQLRYSSTPSSSVPWSWFFVLYLILYHSSCLISYTWCYSSSSSLIGVSCRRSSIVHSVWPFKNSIIKEIILIISLIAIPLIFVCDLDTKSIPTVLYHCYVCFQTSKSVSIICCSVWVFFPDLRVMHTLVGQTE